MVLAVVIRSVEIQDPAGWCDPPTGTARQASESRQWIEAKLICRRGPCPQPKGLSPEGSISPVTAVVPSTPDLP
jgi:hypothetical protein